MSGDPEQEYFADDMVGDHYRAFTHQMAFGDLPEIDLHLRGLAGGHEEGGSRFWGSLCARRRCPEGRESGSDHYTTYLRTQLQCRFPSWMGKTELAIEGLNARFG